MSGETKTYLVIDGHDEHGANELLRQMTFRKFTTYGPKELTLEQKVEFYENEIDLLVEQLTSLEIENYELSQRVTMLEIMIEDIKIGQPKGEMN
jgi:hypothetical protein